MKYYDLRKHWTKRIKPHLGDAELNHILVRDFNKYTLGRWGKPFTADKVPHDFESNDWHLDHRGRKPQYWKYVKHSACHWTVNFALRIANLAEPQRPWRIISSQAHSTVWDGQETLFDFNFQALGVTPDECFSVANQGSHLAVGEYLPVFFADHYSIAQDAGEFYPDAAAATAHALFCFDRFGVYFDQDDGVVVAYSNDPYHGIPREVREGELAALQQALAEAGYAIAGTGRYPLTGPNAGHTYMVAVTATVDDVEPIGALFDASRASHRQQESRPAEESPSAWVRTHTIANPLAVLPPELYEDFQSLVPALGEPARVIDQAMFSQARGQHGLLPGASLDLGLEPARADAIDLVVDHFLDCAFLAVIELMADDESCQEFSVGLVAFCITDKGELTFSYSVEGEQVNNRVKAAEAVTTVLRVGLPDFISDAQRDTAFRLSCKGGRRR
ncbi:MAG: hypothetical protein K8U57_35240 [Planctomycetes bacterium]|nr:hypothetical protein [Planctomycetota bacterium]